jgi:large subunit ribosomal protein L10
MNREEKKQIVSELVESFNTNSFVYLADTDGLSANHTNALRRLLFQNGVTMRMVKNTLVKRAMDESEKDFGDLVNALSGTTCVMFAENVKAPATSIKKFREKSDKPLLKGAWIDSSVYLGDDQLTNLVNLKSKEDLIGDIIHLLQSPAKNVIGGLQSNAGQKIAGLVKALSER